MSSVFLSAIKSRTLFGERMKLSGFAAAVLLICCTPTFASAQSAGEAKASNSLGQKQTNQPKDLIGVWHGHLHGSESDCSLTVDIKQNGGDVQGTLTCIGKEGTSKHYFRGHYDPNTKELICKDKGIDIEWGAPGWYPKPVDSYTLELVDEGNKLVGSLQQADTKAWLAITRDDRKSQTNLSILPAGAHPLPDSKPPDQVAPSHVPTQSTSDVKDASSGDAKKGSKITPEVVAYMTYVERTLKSHWHPPSGNKTRSVTTIFKIEKDGSVSDVHLDPDSSKNINLDEACEAALDAIKLSAPFKTVSPTLLADVKDDHLDIRFKFDYNVHRRASRFPLLPLMLGRGVYVIPTQ